jgi:hypothetical protein
MSRSVTVADAPDGSTLFAEIVAFVTATPGMTIEGFGRLLGRSGGSVRNIAAAGRPKAETVARVRAIIAGRREPFAPFEPKPRAPGVAENRTDGPRVGEEQVNACRRAAETRLPGETLAEALEKQALDRAAQFREAGRLTAAHPLPAPQLPHSPRARAVPAIGPDRWEALRQLSAEAEESLPSILDAVIGAGILCVKEDLREGLR